MYLSDPKYEDGYYCLDESPVAGLSAARMSALLTYRSRNSFETKFARNTPSIEHQNRALKSSLPTPSSLGDHSMLIHNDGCRAGNGFRSPGRSPFILSDSTSSISSEVSSSSLRGEIKDVTPAQTYFSAQSYLRYQGNKFISRFDANCYISVTRKIDTHDLARDRVDRHEDISEVLHSIEQPSLIIGIKTDGLFTYSEQEFLAENIPNARLEHIESPEGHDAFLLEFNLINGLIIDFLNKNVQNIMKSTPRPVGGLPRCETQNNSLFGEAEDLTDW